MSRSQPFLDRCLPQVRSPALQLVKIKRHEDSKYSKEHSHPPILYYFGGCTLHYVPLHVKEMKSYHVIVVTIFPRRSLTLGILRFNFQWYFPGKRKKIWLLCHRHFLDLLCVCACMCVSKSAPHARRWQGVWFTVPVGAASVKIPTIKLISGFGALQPRPPRLSAFLLGVWGGTRWCLKAGPGPEQQAF